MDDDAKDFRRGKPQQKLYRPGSGPLKKSNYGLDIKMERYRGENDNRVRDYDNQGTSLGSKQQIFINSSRIRKPEQQLYVPRSSGSYCDIDKQGQSTTSCDYSSLPYERRITDKHNANSNSGSYNRGGSVKRDHKDNANNDLNYNRSFRQTSEPRSISPSQISQDSVGERNRDSRSMETSGGRHNLFGREGKPPSGRRNSSGYPSDAPRHKYTVNIDNLPPRLRKKFLAESGHQSLDSNEYINKDRYSSNPAPQVSCNSNPFYNSTNMISYTLPSRGRGRLRDNEGFDKEKFMSVYLKNYEANNSRCSTPSSSCMNLYDSHLSNNKDCHEGTSINWNTGYGETISDLGTINYNITFIVKKILILCQKTGLI